MPVKKNELANGPVHIEIGSYKFETVCSFTYLGSEVNCKNDITDEIKRRVLAANKRLHGLRKHLKSRLISRKTRIMIFRPVEENGTWRRRYNHELYKLFNEPDIIGYIKVKRLQWDGHLIRTSKNRIN
jgi:hypothetical protein